MQKMKYQILQVSLVDQIVFGFHKKVYSRYKIQPITIMIVDRKDDSIILFYYKTFLMFHYYTNLISFIQ